MSVLNDLCIRLTSRKIGRDRFGNTYWEARWKRDIYGRPRRRVTYAGGEVEATRVPPEWWGWLHYTSPLPLSEEAPRYPWQKEHRPNATGTAEAWRPPGRERADPTRLALPGDYDAWTPGHGP